MAENPAVLELVCLPKDMIQHTIQRLIRKKNLCENSTYPALVNANRGANVKEILHSNYVVFLNSFLGSHSRI